MRDIAVIASAQIPSERRSDLSEIEMVQKVVTGAIEKSGIDRRAFDFWCSGSADMLCGRPFSFVSALDAIGAWPPIRESHVEMDGAWALYEAWLKLQSDPGLHCAIVYCFGQSSLGPVPDILATQLDPYYETPLWPDSISVAAIQARALLDGGRYTERDFAEVAVENRRRGKSNPNAQLTGDFSIEEAMSGPYISSPLRKHYCPPLSDGACAIVIASREKVDELGFAAPAWIRGFDHRVEAQSLGVRDLTSSASTQLAGRRAGARGDSLDVAELHAPFAHQELILREALELGGSVSVNPSGGALAANPIMVAGLLRICEAAGAIHRGEAKRALGHATSGPALQQNLVCVMEAN